MKKIFVLFLALTVLAGAAFAQATVNGYVYAESSINEEGDAGFYARLRLNLGWTSEGGNAMFGARIQNTTGAATGGDIAWETNPIKYLYGRLLFADGLIQVDAGRLFIWDYDVCSGISDWYLGNVENWAYALDYTNFNAGFAYENGVSVQVKPADGMSFGVAFAPDGATADLGLEDFNLGFLYSIEGVGDIKAIASFGEEIGVGSYLFGSFTYTGVENLAATLGYMGLTDFDHKIYAIVNYSTDAFTVDVAPMFSVTESEFYAEASFLYNVSEAFDFIALLAYDQNMGLIGGEYMFGVECRVKAGAGYLAIVPMYTEGVGFSLPISVRVDF